MREGGVRFFLSKLFENCHAAQNAYRILSHSINFQLIFIKKVYHNLKSIKADD